MGDHLVREKVGREETVQRAQQSGDVHHQDPVGGLRALLDDSV